MVKTCKSNNTVRLCQKRRSLKDFAISKPGSKEMKRKVKKVSDQVDQVENQHKQLKGFEISSRTLLLRLTRCLVTLFKLFLGQTPWLFLIILSRGPHHGEQRLSLLQ